MARPDRMPRLQASMSSRWMAINARLIGLALTGGAALAEPVAPLAVTPIADGAYVFYGAQQDASAANSGAIANLGFVIGERCVAVIDTGGSRVGGGRLRAPVRAAARPAGCAGGHTRTP